MDGLRAIFWRRHAGGWLALVTLAWLWLALGGLISPALATWWGDSPGPIRKTPHHATIVAAGAHHLTPASPPGVPSTSSISDPISLFHDTAATLPAWLVMTVAMMGPSTCPAVSHVAVNSLSWRRRRAKAEFLAGYLGIWTLSGVGFTLAHHHFPVTGAALPAILLLAGVWQLSRFKVRQLRECHRSTPLPATGWRAEWASAKFGLRYGWHCLASCWLLMLAAMTAPTRPLLWMFAATALITAEKLLERPRRVLRFSAVALAGMGVLAAAF